MSNCNIQSIKKIYKLYGAKDLCSTLPRLVNLLKQDLQVGISFILISNNRNKIVNKGIT